MAARTGISAGLGLLAVLLAGPAGAAEGWIATGREAGFAVDGAFAGLSFACSGEGGLVLVAGRYPGSFEPGRPRTVALDVDGTAFRFEALPRPSAGGTDFVAALGGERAARVVEALRKGRRAEVSGPAGRYPVPLAGSGKALGALSAACG